MSRWFLSLVVAPLCLLAGCKSEPAPVPETPPPAEAKSEPEVVEEVVVVEETKTEPDEVAATPTEPAEPAEPEVTTPRPSVMLGIMLQPMTVAMQSVMETTQGLAGPLTSGGIPGLPQPNRQATEAPADEAAPEAPAETPAESEPAPSEPTEPAEAPADETAPE